MAENHIGSAIVTKNELAGIFTVTDACRALAEVLERRAGDCGSAA